MLQLLFEELRKCRSHTVVNNGAVSFETPQNGIPAGVTPINSK
ncbi:MAG: hypothetical protein WBZ36_00830 [Candidatus Nitrosopolaris sp.]